MDEYEDIPVEVVEDFAVEAPLVEEPSLETWDEWVFEEPVPEEPQRGDGTLATEPIKERGHQGPDFGRFSDQF